MSDPTFSDIDFKQWNGLSLESRLWITLVISVSFSSKSKGNK